MTKINCGSGDRMCKVNRGNAVFTGLLVVAGLVFAQRLTAAARAAVSLPVPARDELVVNAKTETAVFAGGCFWGIQSVFQHVKGLVSATSGFAVGTTDRPSYEDVSSGTTGHAESVRVVFDPSQV